MLGKKKKGKENRSEKPKIIFVKKVIISAFKTHFDFECVFFLINY